jgi:hypothetical protein
VLPKCRGYLQSLPGTVLCAVDSCGNGSIELAHYNLSALCDMQRTQVYGDDIKEAGELMFSDLHIPV